jgi:hypothetical protein
MRFTFIAQALVAAAMVSASPAFANPVAGMQHRNALHGDTVLGHGPMTAAPAAKPLSAFDAAPKLVMHDDWPNNLILG